MYSEDGDYELVYESSIPQGEVYLIKHLDENGEHTYLFASNSVPLKDNSGDKKLEEKPYRITLVFWTNQVLRYWFFSLEDLLDFEILLGDLKEVKSIVKAVIHYLSVFENDHYGTNERSSGGGVTAVYCDTSIPEFQLIKPHKEFSQTLIKKYQSGEITDPDVLYVMGKIRKKRVS
ncbi:hypothetical protein JCM30760_26700 [Thiomicrorhabdus hydrogeniphila]